MYKKLSYCTDTVCHLHKPYIDQRLDSLGSIFVTDSMDPVSVNLTAIILHEMTRNDASGPFNVTQGH